MTEQKPIPVKEAVAAVQAAIEQAKKGQQGSAYSDTSFVTCARAGYAATLEFVLWMLQEMQDAGGIDDLDSRRPIYSAMAPIVAWHRAQKESGR